MKKRMIFVVLILTVFLTGCNDKVSQDSSKSNINNNTEIKATSANIQKTIDNKSNNESSSNKDRSTLISEQDNGGNSKIYIGMSKNDLISVLNSLKIDVTDETEITSNKDSWDWGNKVLDAGDLTFTFDKEQNLYEIIVFDENITTTLGLKIGDSIDSMEKLYGKKYVSYQTDNATVYEYFMGNNYFYAAIEDNKVADWGISKYKFDK